MNEEVGHNMEKEGSIEEAGQEEAGRYDDWERSRELVRTGNHRNSRTISGTIWGSRTKYES